MVLVRISGAGLSSIGMLVVVLWACILGEHLIIAGANREFTRVMTELRELQLKKAAEPASLPAPRHFVRRPAVG